MAENSSSPGGWQLTSSEVSSDSFNFRYDIPGTTMGQQSIIRYSKCE